MWQAKGLLRHVKGSLTAVRRNALSTGVPARGTAVLPAVDTIDSCLTGELWQTLNPQSCSRLYHGSRGGDAGMRGTTVLCVRKGDRVVVIADGQVTMGAEIVKPNVRKVRRLGENGSVIAGFAGATADAFTLFDRLETRLDEYPGQLTRAAVELAKAWRTDKFLRRLDAVMVVADAGTSLTITGNGDVLEPYDGVIGIGSGGSYAVAAARALLDLPEMDAETIARKAMKIAADACIYTNHNFTVEQIEIGQQKDEESVIAAVAKKEEETKAFLTADVEQQVDNSGLQRTEACLIGNRHQDIEQR